MAALQDTTPIQYHPDGDRTKEAKADPIVNAIGYIVDSAANARELTEKAATTIKIRDFFINRILLLSPQRTTSDR
jgi:hypothetical protein